MVTIKEQKSAELEIKKSKFLSYAFSVFSVSEAVECINSIRKMHEKATHVCYAYKLNNNIEKFDDDGEPTFTAGKPILEVIKKRGFNNIIILVVRYFGGVKLGAGGLVRAYSKSASEVLQLVELKEIISYTTYENALSYDDYSAFLNKVNNENNVLLRSVNYLENVVIMFSVKTEYKDELIKNLNDQFNMKNFKLIGEEFLEK